MNEFKNGLYVFIFGIFIGIFGTVYFYQARTDSNEVGEIIGGYTEQQSTLTEQHNTIANGVGQITVELQTNSGDIAEGTSEAIRLCNDLRKVNKAIQDYCISVGSVSCRVNS